MTVSQAAKIANVTEETIRRWIRSKKIRAYKESRKSGYSIEDDSFYNYIGMEKKWTRLKRPLRKTGKTECLVVMDGIALIMDIRIAEPKDVKRFISQLDKS